MQIRKTKPAAAALKRRAKRKAIYKEIQDLILEDLPYVMLAYYAKPYVVARNVNVPPNAVNTERIFLRGVTIGPG